MSGSIRTLILGLDLYFNLRSVVLPKALDMSLNKNSPIPLYYQLAELLREQIRTGELQPGDQVPPERVLSERYHISRMTTRQAIAYLTREGSIISEHGRGTFVAEPKLTFDAFHLLGFTEAIIQHGGKPISRVLEQEIVAAPARVATDLALGAQQQVVKIVRLRLADSTPMLLETIYISAALCPGLEREDLAARSLYSVMEQQYGITISRARQTLEATVANEYESQLFAMPVGTPMILLEAITSDAGNRPVEYAKAVYRGDRFKFAYESERSAVSSAHAMPRLSIVLA